MKPKRLNFTLLNIGLKHILTVFLSLPVFFPTYGQALFSNLNIAGNTKSTALGGFLTAHPENNVSLFSDNPALLEDVEENISLHHTFYFADISADQLNYSHNFGKAGLIGFSLQYFNYGMFDGYDETGQASGEFRVNDFVMSSGYAHNQGNFSLGGSVKFAASDFIDYFASAVLFDVGGTFKHPAQDFVVGLVIKNFGFILSDYTNTSDSYLPFDVRLGAAYKPEHMPLRFNINFYNLTEFDIPNTGGRKDEEPGSFDKIFSHVSLGTEVLVSKNFHLLAGYNHLKRTELRLENKSAGAGISYGLEIAIKNFDFAYSRVHYVAGKAMNQIGLNLDLKGFNKTKL